MKRFVALTLPLSILLLGACSKSGDRVVNVGDFKGGGGDDTGASACSDDAREEDDEVAYVSSKKSSKDGEKFEAMSCPGDDDVIHLFADGRAGGGAAITWSRGDGDLRVDVLDASGGLMRLGSTDLAEASSGRFVVQRESVRGDFYVRVRNRAGTPLKYRVEVGVVQGDTPPPPPAIVTQTPAPVP